MADKNNDEIHATEWPKQEGPTLKEINEKYFDAMSKTLFRDYFLNECL